MNNDEAARIIAEARETVRRLSDKKPPPIPPLPDLLERWKADADARTAAREAAKAEVGTAPKASWAAIDERIQAVLAVERLALAEALGENLGKLLDEERAHVDEVLRKL